MGETAMSKFIMPIPKTTLVLDAKIKPVKPPKAKNHVYAEDKPSCSNCERHCQVRDVTGLCIFHVWEKSNV